MTTLQQEYMDSFPEPNGGRNLFIVLVLIIAAILIAILI